MDTTLNQFLFLWRMWTSQADKKSFDIYNGKVKQIMLEELVAPGCHICRAFEEFWHAIEKDWPNVVYKKTDVTTDEGQQLAQKFMIFASPGIILDGELWVTGGFDKEQFVAKLKELSA